MLIKNIAKNMAHRFLLFGLLTQWMFWGMSPQLVSAEAVPEEAPSLVRLVISAVQITGGSGRTQEDFIELYNPTDEPFDLNGYRLVKRTAAATTDTTVQAWTSAKVVLPHHFFLWANSGYSAISALPDVTSSATLADNNGIALRHGSNDTGEAIESLAWGSTANGFNSVSSNNPTVNESLVRQDLFSEIGSFEILSSAPRNSETELLPDPIDPPVEDSPEEEPLADTLPVDDPPTDEPAEELPTEHTAIKLEITELLPNPVGSDLGFEKVELYNEGSEAVNLADYKLDDVQTTDPLSSNAFIIPAETIEPDSYLALTIPAGKFSLNNTAGDAVTLFSPLSEIVATAFYNETAQENLSYSYFDNGWQWAPSTFGESNGQPPSKEEAEEEPEDDADEEIDTAGDYDNSGLEISEIHADPIAAATEFVEIYNAGEETAQLSQVALWVGERHKVLPEHELEPGKYYVVNQTGLPAQLRNSGQQVKLMEGTTVLSIVTYPAAIDGSAYARFEDGFLWTTEITDGKSNVLKLPEAVKKENVPVVSKPVKTAIAKVSKVAASKPVAKTTIKPAATATAIPKASTANTNSWSDKPEPTADQKQKDSMGKIIAMGAAAVAAGVIALYKLVFTGGIE